MAANGFQDTNSRPDVLENDPGRDSHAEISAVERLDHDSHPEISITGGSDNNEPHPGITAVERLDHDSHPEISIAGGSDNNEPHPDITADEPLNHDFHPEIRSGILKNKLYKKRSHAVTNTRYPPEVSHISSKGETQSIGSHPETSQLRNRRRAHMPPDALMESEGSGQNPCYTSKMNFPPIPGSLLEYGLALMEFDSQWLKLFTKTADPNFDSQAGAILMYKPIPTKTELYDVKSWSQDILAQFHEVEMGRQHLNLFYLEDSYVIKFWKTAFQKFLILGCNPTLGILNTMEIPSTMEMEDFVETLGHSATKVANALIDAAKKETLSREREATIRERWTILDALFSNALKAPKGVRIKKPKLLPTWPDLEEQMKIIAADKRRPGFLVNPAAVESSQASPKPTILLWSTCIIIVGVGMPMVAQGYQYSPHQHGTRADADFWFLLQSSSMNVLAIFTMALPLWNRQTSGWTWGPMVVAVICALLAPVFYIFFDTEWSALLGVFAGAIQAFITVQIALIAHKGGVSEHAKKD